MRRDQRLRRREDFAAVYRQGRPASNELLALRARRNELGHNRYGFSVGKRIGKAVVRNRLKRRLRAAIKSIMPSLSPGAHTAAGWDVIIIGRAPAATVNYDELVRALTQLFRRARLMESRE